MDKMNYSTFFKEDSTKTTTVVVVFCDFQPPHVGHRVLIDYAKSFASFNGYEYLIIPSNDDYPLTKERRNTWLNLMFPNTKFSPKNFDSYSHAFKSICKTYKSIVVVCDKVSANQVTDLLESMDVFEKTRVVTCVDRNPDHNHFGWSNDKLLRYVKDGNIKLFKTGVPMLNDSQSVTLFNELSDVLKVHKYHTDFETMRENFVNGMFKINDVVQDESGVYKVLERGSNHLIVVSEDGKTMKKWFESMEIVNEDFNLNVAISQGGITYNGFTSSNLNLSVDLIRVLGEVIEAYDATEPLTVLNLIKSCDDFCGLIKSAYPEYSPKSDDDIAIWNSTIKRLEKVSARLNFTWFDDIIDAYKDEIDSLNESSRLSTKKFLKKLDDVSSPDLPDADEPTDDEEEIEDRPTKLKPGSSLVDPKKGDGYRRRTVKNYYIDEEAESENLENELDALEDELDDLADDVSDDDVLDVYDPSEFALVDDEGNHLEDLDDGKEPVNEVLSRQGRIKAKMRFKMSQSKRLRKAKLALHRRSTSEGLRKKALRLATRTLKMKMAKKDLAKLSISEKERLERAIAKKHKMVERLAKRLTSKIRKVENQRLTHRGYTK